VPCGFGTIPFIQFKPPAGEVVVCGKLDEVCAGHAGGPIAGVQTIPVPVPIVPVVPEGGATYPVVPEGGATYPVVPEGGATYPVVPEGGATYPVGGGATSFAVARLKLEKTRTHGITIDARARKRFMPTSEGM
jgi:hypothetical protein